MTGIEILSSKTFLAIGAAAGYALATVLMKMTSEVYATSLVVMLAAVLTLTVAAEILLLRQVELGLAYIAVIATETILVLMFAHFIGEGLTPKEILGGILVITGAAMVSF